MLKLLLHFVYRKCPHHTHREFISEISIFFNIAVETFSLRKMQMCSLFLDTAPHPPLLFMKIEDSWQGGEFGQHIHQNDTKPREIHQLQVPE